MRMETKKRTDRTPARLALRALSLACSILPAAICVLCYFPLWRTRGALAELSGVTALLLAVTALPLFRAIKRLLRSPSVWILWLFAFLAFRLLASIADEMAVISFAGFLGNLIGAALWKAADGTETRQKEAEEEVDIG